MNTNKIAPIHNAPLIVNEHGLHVQVGSGMLPIDGLTADDVEAYAHIKHRSGMNDTLFANTRIHPFQEVVNNTIIRYYEG